MTLKFGNVNIIPYLANQGYKFTIVDIDGPNAGRSLDGLMYRDRVTYKYKIEITCKPLTFSDYSTIIRAVNDEYTTVTFTNPFNGQDNVGQFYCSSKPFTYVMKKGGVDYVAGITLSLIQR